MIRWKVGGNRRKIIPLELRKWENANYRITKKRRYHWSNQTSCPRRLVAPSHLCKSLQCCETCGTMTIRDSGETLRDLAETAWQMILCRQARSQWGRTGLALGRLCVKDDPAWSTTNKLAIAIVIITLKTCGRRNRIAQRWRNWFGAARQGLPRRQVPSSQAGWKTIKGALTRGALFTW